MNKRCVVCGKMFKEEELLFGACKDCNIKLFSEIDKRIKYIKNI